MIKFVFQKDPRMGGGGGWAKMGQGYKPGDQIGAQEEKESMRQVSSMEWEKSSDIPGGEIASLESECVHTSEDSHTRARQVVL